MKKTPYYWLCQAQEMAIEKKLDSHPAFRTTPLEKLMLICNGCGAANAKFDFVPDTIYGLSVTPACHIHDYDYSVGMTIEYKEMSDRRMLNNLLRLIESANGWWNNRMKPLRRRRALKYYEAVHALGGVAFWEGKNE